MIIGTAGHIDHGKSALVAALTGRTMDRLAEEKRRGITIDLNFAPLELDDGQVAGIVDVPGHEDFVRTMVAGASGVDLALLVVAADEGVMPQTEEHLAVLEQLAIPIGIPVLTKCDLVEADWLELVSLELTERLRRSPVVFEPPVETSAVTGQGVPNLRARIAARARDLPVRSAADAFRLPVDRAFSMPGIGTVVTGTAWSGSVGIGDRVLVLPAGVEGRVRSIESHDRAVPRSIPGARTALGIAGVERSAIGRGDVIVTDALPWTATSALDVEISLQPSAPRPLGPRSRVRVHLGTAEVMARVHPRGAIEAGQRGVARLTLESPVVARGGDCFVLRSYSPVETIGGGRVLDPMPPRRLAAWPERLAAETPDARLQALLERHRVGIEMTALPLLLGVPDAAAQRLIGADRSLRQVGAHLIPGKLLKQVAARAVRVVHEYHTREPSERGMSLETLRRSLSAPMWLVEAALQELTAGGRLRLQDGIASQPDFEPRVAGGAAEIDRVVAHLDAAGLGPPTIAELETQLARPQLGSLLRLAAGQGRVEAVERDRYYARAALDRFVQTLRAIGSKGDITVGDLRERLGASRKFLIPLLEWADRTGVTMRVGDVRRLPPQGR